MADATNSHRYMVIVADDDDEEAGGIAFFDTQEEAAHHMEALLESGSQIENINVFAITVLPTKVHYRPVVTISPEEPRKSSRATEPDPEPVEAKTEA